MPDATTPTATLADIVNANPAAARILERHRLDYCCGGRHTLATACTDAGVDPAVVQAELDAAGAGPEAGWTAMDAATLVDHIESTHHRYLHEELPRLSELAAKVLGVHGGRHGELAAVARTYEALRADLEPHLAKEEQVLFPMIRQLAAAGPAAPPTFHGGSIASPIRVMLLEHDRAGELLAELRTLTGDYAPPHDACASYTALYLGLAELEADTHLHVHKENNVLFPLVERLEAALGAPA
jgi:regulator of cell morphogenesis and NO signaling